MKWPSSSGSVLSATVDNQQVRGPFVPVNSMCHWTAINYYSSALELSLDGTDLSVESPQEMLKGTLSHR